MSRAKAPEIKGGGEVKLGKEAQERTGCNVLREGAAAQSLERAKGGAVCGPADNEYPELGSSPSFRKCEEKKKRSVQ